MHNLQNDKRIEYVAAAEITSLGKNQKNMLLLNVLLTVRNPE